MNDSNEVKEADLSQDERVVLDGTVWRKLDKWILPLCTSFFLIAMVDASNIGYARIAGLQKSLTMSNYQFSLVLTLGHVPFIFSEFPTTLLLKHVGPNRMLPAMVMLWGVISVLQGLVSNYLELMLCRCLLGLVGGGLLPSIIFYLSFFYPRKRLQVRVGTFFAMSSLSGILSGLLAAAIEQLDGVGGKPGWAWIFILEGICTSAFGVLSFFLFPRSPEKARFLTKTEQTFVVSVLKYDGSVSDEDKKDKFTWREVVEAVKSPHVWLLSVTAFCSGTMIFGLARFEPTIVAGLGYAGSRAQLMSMPPYAVSSVLCFISAIVSDRYRCRGYTVIFFSLLKVIGSTMFYASASSHIRYASLFFSVTGSFCVAPAMITWMTNNSTPHARRATAVAISFILVELGGILSTWLIGTLSPAPDYTSAMITFIAMSVCSVALASINLVYLRQQNQLKAQKREVMRKEEEPEGLGDRSAWFVYGL